ncbi:hypothetical protein JA1_005286 [Spathaspora sp. JA1]|nr:hypothetical protein JA1_005286 [Spathaspora sp. JA1]
MSSGRITSHMNADHQLALIDYLTVYADINPNNLIESSVKITHVDTKQLIIDYNLIADPESSKTFAIYWDDALENENVKVKEMKDIKGKLIAMAKYCAAEQGFAVKKLTKVIPPTIASGPVFLLWGFLFLNIYNPNILRGISGFKKYVIDVLPFYKKIESNSLKIAIGLGIIHICEIVFFTRGYLRKYRTPTRQRYGWYGLQLIEGFYVIQRLVKATK